MHLEHAEDRSLPCGRFVALRMNNGAPDTTAHTMATAVFQRDALPLYQLCGTPAGPCWVLLVDDRAPGVGVYREQHILAHERHLRILSTRPRALRTALNSGNAWSHFRMLLAQSRDDPFVLEGPIDDEIEFFGGSTTIRIMLDDIRVRHASVGLFGLEKWGTTSLLKRVRAELLTGGCRPIAWIDCQSTAQPTEEWLSREIITNLQLALPHRSRKRTSHVPATIDGVLTVTRQCADAGLRDPPVIFFDRVDELVDSRRVDAEMAMGTLQCLRYLARPKDGQPRIVLVLGGVHDGLITARSLPIGDNELENPLWRLIKAYYTPLFTADETAEFMLRMATRTGLELAPEALERIHDLTGGHKYLCRLLGSEIRTRCIRRSQARGRVDRELVNDAAQAIVIAHHDYFSTLFARSPSMTRRLISRLAADELTHAKLLRRDPSSGTDAPTVAEHLEAARFALRHQIIEERGHRYRLAIQLFAHWLMLAQQDTSAADKATPAIEHQSESESNELVNTMPQAGQHANPVDTIVRSPPAASSNAPGYAGATWTQEDVQLRKIMTDAFTSDELELLLAGLDVPFQQVTDRLNPIDIQVLRIVEWFRRRQRIHELRSAVQAARPERFVADAEPRSQVAVHGGSRPA